MLDDAAQRQDASHLPLTREQEELATWLACHDFRLWATWTFGTAWPDGPTPTAVQYHVTNWCTQQDLRPAFVVAEQGWSGQRRWHAHGLLGGHGPLGLDAWRRDLWRNWYRRYGRCRFEPLGRTSTGVISASEADWDITGGVRTYVAKYCLKGLGDCRWWITEDAAWH